MRRAAVSVCLAVCLATATLTLSGCGGAILGSKYTYTYHDPSCIWAEEMSEDGKEWFGSIADAESAGYEPCGTCNPTEDE